MLKEYTDALEQSPSGIVRYDEIVGSDGDFRPAWKTVTTSALALDSNALRRVSSDAARLLSDDGVRYSRPGESPSSWRLDPLPVMVAAEDWSTLQAGLVQRAELLNALLVDLYGPQRLLAGGVIPPAVVFAHSGFLRALRGSSPEASPLAIAAADVIRTVDGEWQVVADRAGAPSGLGYAMENRRVVSRVMPKLYREAGPHRIAPYLHALRDTLLDAAPRETDDPRVVLLSPGPRSETSYDQAYLASRLGFPLVQGSDLVVRDGVVWTRAVGELQRVDVIVRRVDAAWSDPLELRGDSQLGVTGLVEAVRRGTVRVVNGLGSTVLENPGLTPFLARACEELLGEPLRLASPCAHWLGDPDELAAVRDRLDEFEVRVVDPAGSRREERGTPGELLARIVRAPHRFVAQERPRHSQTVAFGPLGLRPEPVVIRAFTMRHGSGYRALMGGLATVVETGRTPRSKDVWVLKSSPDEADQRLVEHTPSVTASAPAAVPRVLEDMFWIGRYAERAEDTLRLVLAAHGLAEDFRGRPAASVGLRTLRVLVAQLRGLSPSMVDEDDFDAEFRSLLLDMSRPASVAQSVAALREAAQSVRDQLSPDVWRVFASIDRAAAALGPDAPSPQVNESAGRMLTAISALHGVSDSMMRDDGWRMMMFGRAVERCQQVVRLLDGAVTVRRGVDVDRNVLATALTVAESAVTHRRRYRGSLGPEGVVDLLLSDEANPRSVAFNLARAAELLAALTGSTGATRPERLLDDLREEVAGVDAAALTRYEDDRRPELESLLGSVRSLLNRLADAVAETHLVAAPTPRSFDLVTMGGEAR
ncbi:MAG: circularly permuted type 2 ATP-grasp protein [Aeromicrobium sp.]|uniref:circularly permuted type 2 ATP-grasp protein n=1 Tax=Aeromicrobium sp. TaxID=1871063 RepID=UPI0039E5E7BC